METNQIDIKKSFSKTRLFSFQEKQDRIFKMRDKQFDKNDGQEELKILEAIEAKIEHIDNLLIELETISWLNDVNEETLIVINDIIVHTKDLTNSYEKQYSIIVDRKLQNNKNTVSCFREAIEELHETVEDLESRFFVLPKMNHFVLASKKLSLIQ